MTMLPLEQLQLTISAREFAPETECVEALLASLAVSEDIRTTAFMQAKKLVTHIRENGGSGVEAFLHEYGLDTREGIAVMCLAEALLRIPDPKTADALIHSTFDGAEWQHHLGHSDSFFVNASSWGLLLTGRIVHLGGMEGETPPNVIGKLVRRLGEPLVREALKKAMRLIGAQFVLGETIEDALKHAKAGEGKGYRFSFDMLGEGARTEAQAEAYLAAYLHAVEAVGVVGKAGGLMEANSISVKLSALHPRYSLVKEARVMRELLPRLRRIVLRAKELGIAISIDAEEATRMDIGLKLFTALLRDPAFDGYDGIGYVLQAYQKRAFYVVDWLAELCHETGRRIPLRLVKGAYWDSEIKLAQMQGLPSYPVFTRKEHTDLSYLACAEKILSYDNYFFPQFATHNALTVAAIMEMGQGKNFELQRLHGMGEALHDQVVGKVPCRIYAPVGRHEDLLAYLIRRLLENGASTSFVHHVMDKSTPLETLLSDPVVAVRAQPDYAAAIADPLRLYKDRKNSSGSDLGNMSMLSALKEALAFERKQFPAPVADLLPEELEQVIVRACGAFESWQAVGLESRARMLESVADRLEAEAPKAISVITLEADRTLMDAIAEVRETADFCRYYASEARRLMAVPHVCEGPTGEHNALQLGPRGVIACISPWNFPLAIFIGQVAAALAAGNCVIAKPAEQTPRIADYAVRLMHEAGIPKPVLQLAPGGGETIGAALVKDERVNGVVFTGSLAAAKAINLSLAQRKGPIVPLIAETGGQNCMIVDSSALPEQAVDDIIQSAFNSAGQRCSSLRVLYVQEEIADKLNMLIAGAMQELTLGDPSDPATDIGPVIDEDAQKRLQLHIAHMEKTARLIAKTPLSPTLAEQGTFVAPHAFEIKSISELKEEVFGPILHVIRFRAGELSKVCDEVNSTGYALTFGLQSRVHEHAELVQKRIRAGNIYINRNMIGATVGVQPFGGEGLSGTGPKAGGPHYLMRFCVERAVTINTAAIGGNIELLSNIR